MNQPKVSIIVPIYNVEKYLDRCMQSLLNQTLKDIEIIMVDDESPDNCPAMCDEYAKQDNRVKVIHKKNGGLGFARNSGLELVTGEYVAFLDSDDFVDVTMYEKLYTFLKKNKLDTCFCSSNLYYSANQIVPVNECKEERIFSGRHAINNFMMNMLGADMSITSDDSYMISVWKAIYSTRIINTNSIRFNSEKLIASEDLFFHIDYLSKAVQVGFIPQNLHYYFYNSTSISKTYSEQKYKRLTAAIHALEGHLKKYLLPQFFNYYYQCQIVHLYKIILNYEIEQLRYSYFKLRNKIAKELKTDILRGAITSLPLQDYTFKKKLYLIALKYRIVDLLILIVKLNKRLK
ncbi:MAG: glycosyl transferase [Bacteroidetes bacterium]|nr:glycosyl transferase [Bacteroidota bacterium]